LITCAKGLTSGTVPMGAVLTTGEIYDAFMTGPEHMIELTHGYTYSAHPLACAAGNATLQLYQDEALFDRVAELAPYWESAIHSLKGTKHVIDIRNTGLIGAIELQPREGEPIKRTFDVFLECYRRGLLVRTTGDIIALSPPFIIEKAQIDRIIETIGAAINATA
jgi:beta-alanine--pyruvate transaminase